MPSAIREYQAFLKWLRVASRPDEDDVRRLANLILSNFNDVAGTSTYRSKRAQLIVTIAREKLATTTDDLPSSPTETATTSIPWLRLKHLTVGPFRGFRQPEQFDLDRRIVLFYGPNGSGKSSLCEALEFALIGSVEEAESKRITPAYYLANLYERRFAPPVLLATTEAGASMPVSPSPDLFRFCFIEKNRIEAFSRLSARSEGKRTELIATLFGAEGFNDFVSDFNTSVDNQLVLVPQNQKELERRREALAADESVLEDAADLRKRLEEEEAPVAASFDSERLRLLEEQLALPLRAESGHTASTLVERLRAADLALNEVETLKEQLDARRSEVSFKSLYESVLALRTAIQDRCPACDTPLTGANAVVQDPFARATTGLAELTALASLQDQCEAAIGAVRKAEASLRGTLLSLIEFVRTQVANPPALDVIATVLAEPDSGRWWSPLWVVGGASPVLARELATLVRCAEEQDLETKSLRDERAKLCEERQQLLDAQVRLAEYRARREQLLASVELAQNRVATFETANAELIEAASTEASALERDQRIKIAYDAFMGHIERFRDQLPGMLIADLNETARELYNGFNRNDPDTDQLASLKLPLQSGDCIEITFNGDSDRAVDALQILSEGHLRCLGLAILLARNLKLGLPFVLFDDAVNAIDPDHRAGIRHTLFEDPQFRNKQIIITCHSEEFIKDIQTMIGAAVAEKECVYYVFLPPTADRSIDVRRAAGHNYVLEAQRELEAGRLRGALGAARRAVENLNRRTWDLLTKHGLGELRLKFDRPKAPLEQRDLANALRKALASPQLGDVRKEQLATIYDAILIDWAYLNRGTHEDQDTEDFDREIVRRLVRNVAALDAVLSNRAEGITRDLRPRKDDVRSRRLLS